MDIAVMAARRVQISLDEKLLAEVDRQPETKKNGRSAFIRQSLLMRLRVKRDEEIDAAYARGYRAKAEAVGADFAPLREGQARLDESGAATGSMPQR